MWYHLRLLYTLVLVEYLVKTQRNSNVCVFFGGRGGCEKFPFSLVSLFMQRCTINSNIPFQNQIFTKKNLYLFHFHEEFTRRGNGRVRNGRVLSWLSCRRNRRIAITIQQTITPPVCKYSTALDCVMRTTRGTTREKCRAYDKTNNKKKKKKNKK